MLESLHNWIRERSTALRVDLESGLLVVVGLSATFFVYLGSSLCGSSHEALHRLAFPALVVGGLLATGFLAVLDTRTPTTRPDVGPPLALRARARVYLTLARFVYCDDRLETRERHFLVGLASRMGFSDSYACGLEAEARRTTRCKIGTGVAERELLEAELAHLIQIKAIPSPVEVRFLQALRLVLAKARHAAGQAAIRVVARRVVRARVPSLRCAYCHDDLHTGQLPRGGCGTVLHGVCWDELRACPSPGCREGSAWQRRAGVREVA